MFGWFNKKEELPVAETYTELRAQIKMLLLKLPDKHEHKQRLLDKLHDKYPANLKSKNIKIQEEELQMFLKRVRRMVNG